MKYISTITKKGQMTLPKKVREVLDLKIPARIYIDFNHSQKTLKIESPKDILEIADAIKIKKPANALRLRAEFEKKYQRK